MIVNPGYDRATAFHQQYSLIELVETYKYLGVIFQEKSDFTQTADALATGGGRALGGLISKLHGLKDFGFKTFEKLYYSCIVPVTDYGSAVWGYKNYAQLDYVQNKAIRYFLGVHRFTPILSLVGDSGWLPSQYRRWLAILRLWNRLILMDGSRLTKRVFNFDYESEQTNGCKDVRDILDKLDLMEYYENKTCIDISLASDRIYNFYANSWPEKCLNVPILRSYVKFKTSFKTENYITLNLNRNERSVMAQFRCGVLPLRVETGRFIGEAVNARICKLCNQGSVEDEAHFLLNC